MDPPHRKHLFASIKFQTAADLESWKKTFPDPSTSPACYATTLDIGCSHVVTAEDAEAGGWIRGFSRVVDLGVSDKVVSRDEPKTPLTPFHGLSPAIKSLRVDFINLLPPRVFDLALSFPLLKDLTVTSIFPPLSIDGDGFDEELDDVWPPYSPAFTGSLKLSRGGVRRIARRLASIPGGIHFRKLNLTQFHEEDLTLITGLVKGCFHTLESLDIAGQPGRLPWPAFIDLSGASKLSHVTFWPGERSVEWIIATLQRITSKSQGFRQITIHVSHYLTDRWAEDMGIFPTFEQWLNLDRLLVQFWESRTIRPMVVRIIPKSERRDGEDWLRELLPEITRRGIIDLIE